MKVLFAYELLHPPYDEGVKKFAFMVAGELQNSHTTLPVKYSQKIPTVLNNLLYIPRLILKKITFKPDICVYMPQASLTFFSYIKIAALHLIYGEKLVVIGTQKRTLSSWQSSFVKKISAPHTFVMSSTMMKDLQALDINAHILNIGIELDRYKPVEDKTSLRKKYKLTENKKILLHVGHIRESRNIRWLIDVQKELNEVQVVIVGSTSTSSEGDLHKELTQAGIVVMQDYLPDVSELYQLSDYYCFPVVINTAAMEVPLSVLESMASNIPVLTTRFGRLTELFQEDDYYTYIENASDIINKIQHGFGEQCNNREKMKSFTWQATANKITEHEKLFS
jgi:glycosyltransferase involved in cell wall biosynthesis